MALGVIVDSSLGFLMEATIEWVKFKILRSSIVPKLISGPLQNCKSHVPGILTNQSVSRV